MSGEGILWKFLVAVAVLGVVNLCIFLASWRGFTITPQQYCSMDSFLRMASSFLDNNGRQPVGELLPLSCPKPFLDKAANSVGEFRKSVRDLIYECNSRRLLHTVHRDSSEPILTLFSSWKDSPHLQEVHRRTVANWSRFLPKFHLVVFTNDSTAASVAKEHGWTIYPILHHAAGGAPVLRTMFEIVIKNFNSTFYGFANSDILFTDALEESLYSISEKLKSLQSVFISGIRTNVPNVSERETASFPNIATAATSRGKLFEIHSADYFFTTKAFPWVEIPPLVIGRPAYDNYIVSHARKIKSTVIDATATVPAIHQTTPKGNQEGFTHTGADYNDKFLKNIGIKPNYESGFVTCAEWKLYETLCGDIDIAKRPSLPKYCAQK